MQKIQSLFKNMLGLLKQPILWVLALALATLISCQSDKKKSSQLGSSAVVTATEKVAKTANEISVMSFNVENLFDTTHDKDREDFTYLPLSAKSTSEVKAFCAAMDNKRYREECETLDWNEATLQAKLENISKVIKYVDAGQGPDNLVLIEVENESILKRLVSEKLQGLGYQTVVLLEGPDTRGIDPGFISKLPLAEKPVLHIIPFKDLSEKDLKSAKRTRGILEVTVKTPDKKLISFYAAHFPSQSNPTVLRKQALEFARALVEQATQKGRIAVFAGDLNVTDEEEKQNSLFKSTLAEVSQISHFVGCSHCEGTHNYRGSWSYLDVIAVSNNLSEKGYEITPESIQVVKSPTHMKPNGTPLRWEPDDKTGVSDHFPLYLRLRPKTNGASNEAPSAKK